MKRLLIIGCLLAQSLPAQANAPVLPVFPTLQFHPPKPERYVLDNGLTVLLLEDRELPLIRTQIMIKGGTQYDPADKVGLAAVFAAAMEQGGSATRSPDTIEKILARTGANIGFNVALEEYSGSMNCRTQDFDTVFEIFADLLRNPSFDSKFVNLEKAKQMEALRRVYDEPDDMARREFRKLIYGPAHPYARIPSPLSLKAIKRSDLDAYKTRYILPNATILAISGDFESSIMKQKIKKVFGDWPRGTLADLRIPEVSSSVDKGVYYISKSLPQSQIRMGHLGFARHNPDHFAWEVFNELWGGDSTSRLFKTVRTEKGLAYAVASAYSEPANLGLIVTICQTRGPETTEAIRLIQQINQEMTRAPFSPMEISRAKQAIMNRYIQNFTSSAQIAGERMTMEFYGFPENYLDTYPNKISAITTTELARVASRYLKPDQSTLLVIGDLSTFRKPLSMFGRVKEVKLQPILMEDTRW